MLGLTAVLKSRMLKAASNKNPPVTPKYCASRHSYERSAGPQHVCSGFAVLGFGIIAGFTGRGHKNKATETSNGRNDSYNTTRTSHRRKTMEYQVDPNPCPNTFSSEPQHRKTRSNENMIAGQLRKPCLRGCLPVVQINA